MRYYAIILFGEIAKNEAEDGTHLQEAEPGIRSWLPHTIAAVDKGGRAQNVILLRRRPQLITATRDNPSLILKAALICVAQKLHRPCLNQLSIGIYLIDFSKKLQATKIRSVTVDWGNH